MRLDTSQQLRMQQKLILAPRMIQSMEILQLPVLELQERIQQELQENPVLEIAEKVKEEAPAAEPPAAEEKPEPEVDYAEAEYDNWEKNYTERTNRSQNGLDDDNERKHDVMQNMPSRGISLQEHLIEQLNLMEIPAALEPLVRHLVTNLKDNGYLPSHDELRATLGQPVADEDLDAAVSFIQRLEPSGIGARSLKECLLLQLTPDTPHADVLRVLIAQHWDDLEHNRIPVIQRRTGFDLATIQEALETLRHLNTRPAAAFKDEQAHYIVPDIIIDKDENGEYVIKLVDDYVPNVYISRMYLQRLKNKQGDAKEREFLKQKIQSAQWLVEAIQQRRATLEKVTRAIVRHQKAFLDHGPEYFTPLKMQQIADDVGVHVTTVSRAVDDKWVQTPRGLFPLKRFFGGGTTTATGEEVAYEQIKRKLLEIIDREDKSNPYSDDDLVNQLSAAGCPVARRTVTKYRKLLKIPSSRQRRQWTNGVQPHP